MDDIDIMGFGAHPDDIELFSGGLFLKMAAQNYNLMIVDLTKGEAGTRGSAAIRAEEMNKANKMLRLKERLNLGLPDGNVSVTPEAKQEIAKIIRKYKPKIIVAPFWEDRHPDHENASRLITESIHIASLQAFKLSNPCDPAWKPKMILYAPHHQFIGVRPSFVVDISNWIESKKQLIMNYSSQFYNPSSKEPETLISQSGFLSALEARARLYGELIGVEFAEPYIIKKAISIDDPVKYF